MKPEKTKPWNQFRKINLKAIDKKSKKAEAASMRHAHKFLVSRIENLRHIRRHLVAWLVLLMMLISLNALQIVFNQSYTSSLQPVENGAYAEGVLGPVNNLNPLFASTDAELSASKLLFSSLLSYDQSGRLQNEVAKSIETKDNGKSYTVNIHDNIKWHDGEPMTAEDIAFTVKTMQDPVANANQFSSWQGIQVTVDNPYQLTFVLPATYAPFPSALTFPIVPQHVLGKVAPATLQENNFNDNPIGSGPFKYIDLQTIDANREKNALQLVRNDSYWKTKPHLARFSLYVYSSKQDIAQALKQREINAANGVKVDESGIESSDIALNNGVYALLRTDGQILLDKQVRKALVQSLDRDALRKKLQVTKSLDSPIVNNLTPQTNQIMQTSYDFQVATQTLATAGWVKNKDGILEKAGIPLELRLVAVDTENYKKITSALVQQWKKLGIKLQVQLIDPEQIQQVILRPRAYDILVYELSMGGDPDGYAFWHSSQVSSSGLNFSNYNSPAADDALLTARGRSAMAQRDAKYVTFARKWVDDVPAIALYRSSLQYSTTKGTYALGGVDVLVSPADRYYNVADWAAETTPTYNTP